MGGVRNATITVSSLLFIIIVFTMASHPPAGISWKERIALIHLRSSLAIRHKQWPIKSDPCTDGWIGIECSNHGHVTGITISNFRRTRIGMQNPQFAVDPLKNLTHLTTFAAHNFPLPGPIPDWFGIKLRFLQLLDLRSCSISGTIPITFNRLTRLSDLYLSNNTLTGELPDDLFSPLIQLQFLDLRKNNFSGGIPVTIWLLPSLKLLDASLNNFTGMLPILNFTNGTTVANISNNLLYGEITPVVEKFKAIDVSRNYLEGIVPTYENRTLLYHQNCLLRAVDQRPVKVCSNFYDQRNLRLEEEDDRNGFNLIKFFLTLLVVLFIILLIFLICLGISVMI